MESVSRMGSAVLSGLESLEERRRERQVDAGMARLALERMREVESAGELSGGGLV